MNRSNKYLNRMLFSISVSMLNRPCLLGVVLHWFSLCVCGVEKFSDKGRFHCALTEHHAMEVYWGSGGIVLLIL
jgi:hypothetical protein